MKNECNQGAREGRESSSGKELACKHVDALKRADSICLNKGYQKVSPCLLKPGKEGWRFIMKDLRKFYIISLKTGRSYYISEG